MMMLFRVFSSSIFQLQKSNSRHIKGRRAIIVFSMRMIEQHLGLCVCLGKMLEILRKC